MVELLVLFLCGDVMLGRGVDQIMATAVDPVLYESYVKDAGVYVELAERESGPIPAPVKPAYVWGEALEVLARIQPRLRLVNLETSITADGEPWPGKGIHYRMHPDNVAILKAADIDGAVVANNHVLDWGYEGLRTTLASLKGAGIDPIGAGLDEAAATAPTVYEQPDGSRVLVFAYSLPTSGIPRAWAAEDDQAGVAYLPLASPTAIDALAESINALRQPGDIVVFSIHWGGNWGYDIPDHQQQLAHTLIDKAGVDIVHGHSSHHVKGIEVYNDRLILYGCGDLLNDYEGIGGHEAYRPDLSLLYFPALEPKTGRLRALRLTPMQIHQMQLRRASDEDTQWLRDRLNRESQAMGVQFTIDDQGHLVGQW